MGDLEHYDLGSYKFNIDEFFPKDLFFEITNVKIHNSSQIIKEESKARSTKKRPWDSNMVIIAADHPARNVTNIGPNDLAMANRHEYLGRIIRTLMLEHVDGVMATPDIFDDLFIITHLLKKTNGASFLDNKILIGCINRGGLSGSPYEMYDPITAYNIQDIISLGLDGAKFMLRLDLMTKMAKYSQKTLQICAEVVRECNKVNLPIFIEPLPVYCDEKGNYKVKKDLREILKVVGVVTALGGSSVNIWLKLPYINNYEQVALSTSNPILMLGGESTGSPEIVLKEFREGLIAGPNVRGCLAGRNILYPGDDDPYAVTLAVSEIIHKRKNVSEALITLLNNRGKKMDYLTSKIL
ncbi:MAG: class I fructose-bisphosphate aldolase [Candidatus Thorarchaeota archaeon]